MKIAVIGGGVSGLVSAWLLGHRHEVRLFESEERLGGHAHTVDVVEPGEDGSPERTHAIDTGFMVFNEPNYPNLCRIFEQLGVRSRTSDMSFSVHCERTGFEYNGRDLDRLFVQRRNVFNRRHLRMLGDIVRFHRQAQADLRAGLPDTVTVHDYVVAHRLDGVFLDRYLVPLGASLWSCAGRDFLGFPIRFVIEFLHNHSMLQVGARPVWRTVKGGSRQYVRRIVERLGERCVPGRQVDRIERTRRGVRVGFADGASEDFDEVVLACHADESLRLIAPPDTFEQEVLACFPYHPNRAVLHTDEGLLPNRPRARASWNYRIPPDNAAERVVVTYDLNRLQGLDARRTYCITLNPPPSLDPSRVVRRIDYRHPGFVPGRGVAQAEHSALIRRRGVSFCGAYWGYGFHEDGVRSALAVCDAFGIGLDDAGLAA